MKKKVLSIILAGFMSVGLLAGCGTVTVEEAGEAPAAAETAQADTTAAETTSESTTEAMTGEGEETIHVFL